MATDREMLDAVRSMFASAAAEAENIRTGRRGMQVSYHGDFAGVLHLPSVARTVRWWAKRLEEHLNPMADLHVFGDDCEWVIASSLEDAKEVLVELGYTPDQDYFAETWEREDDAKPHEIWCDAKGHPAEPFAPGNSLVTLTNAEWIKRCGRGYLFTTEC